MGLEMSPVALLKALATLLGLAVLSASHLAAYRLGGANTRVAVAEKAAKELKAQVAKTAKAQALATALDQRLQSLLSKPKAEPSVRTVIRENPSGCSVPKPVHDSLQDSIARANAALSSGKRHD